MNNLLDEVHAGLFVAEMWSHWTLSKFLHKYINEPIKNTRGIEELSEHCVTFVRGLRVNDIMQRQGEILVDCNKVDLVLHNLLFCLNISHVCNFLIINIPLIGCGQSCEIIGNPKPFLSGLDAIGSALRVLFLFEAAVHNAGDQSLLLGFSEYGKPSNVLVGVIFDSVTVNGLYDLINLIFGHNQFGLLWQRLPRILLLWQFRDIVLSLKIGLFDFSSFKITLQSTFEFLEKLDLNSLLDLRENLTAENEEVIRRIGSGVVASSITIMDGSDRPLNSMPHIGVREITHLFGRKQWIYILRRLKLPSLSHSYIIFLINYKKCMVYKIIIFHEI